MTTTLTNAEIQIDRQVSTSKPQRGLFAEWILVEGKLLCQWQRVER